MGMIISGIIILVVVIGSIFFIGNYFYRLALDRNVSKATIFKETKLDTEEMVKRKEKKEEDKKWIQKNAEEVWIYAKKDNLRLHAYCIKQKSEDIKKWVIVIHGYTAQATELTSAIKEFFNRGYHVLAIDLRGHGKSEGNYIGMGWHDRLDVLDWIEFIIKEDNHAKIILYGVSMGAATVMMTVGEKISSHVKVAIEDCGYTSIWEEFKWQLKVLFHLPAFPVLYVADIVTKMKAGYSLKEGNCIEQLKKAEIPILYIHGKQDEFVPFSMQKELVRSGKGIKEEFVVEGAGHAECMQIAPDSYWKTVNQFIEKNL